MTTQTPATYPDTATQPSAAAARELLARTAELPRTKRELMAVLREYRKALHALSADYGQP